MSSPPPPIGATVSLNAIYTLALQTHDTVTRMDGKLSGMRTELEGLAARVKSLEKTRLLLLAGGFASGGSASYVLHILGATGHS